MVVRVTVPVVVIMPMSVIMPTSVIMVMVAGADPLDMVMVALLGQSDLALETEHLLAVLAHLAVHQVCTVADFLHPVGKGLEHQRMVVEVGRLDELDAGVRGGHPVGVFVDPVHQDAREQEIGEDDNAPEAELHHMLQRRLDQRKGDAGIGGFAPAESDALPQHSRDLRDVRVRIGIGRAAAHGQQERFLDGDRTELGVGTRDRFAHPVAGRADHLQVDSELAAVGDLDLRFPGGIGVDDRGNVVLGMAGREQHPRDRIDSPHPALDQPVQPVADDRRGEFEEPVLDLPVRVVRAQRVGDDRKLAHRAFVAAPVAAHHDSEIVRHDLSPFRGNRPCRPRRAKGQTGSARAWHGARD